MGQLWGSLNNNFIDPKRSKMVQIDENWLKVRTLCGKEAHQISDLWLKYFKRYEYFCICLYIRINTKMPISFKILEPEV